MLHSHITVASATDLVLARGGLSIMRCIRTPLRRGFSLIEIMIVVAIIAVLTLIAIPNYSRSKAQSQLQVCLKNCQTIGTAMETFLVRHSDAEMFAISCKYDLEHGFNSVGEVRRVCSHGGASASSGHRDSYGCLISYLIENGYLGSAPVCPVNPPYKNALGAPLSYKVLWNSPDAGGKDCERWAVTCIYYHRGFGAGAIGIDRTSTKGQNWRLPKYILGMGSSVPAYTY